MVIIVRNTVYRSIREQIDDGISPDPQTPDRDLFNVVEPHGNGLLPKTLEQYNQDIYIVLEIEEELNRTKHPDGSPKPAELAISSKEPRLPTRCAIEISRCFLQYGQMN